MRKIFLISFLFLVITVEAQTNNANNFDFLLGKWTTQWNDSVSSTFLAHKTMNNFLIEENFEFDDHGYGFKSFLYFDPYQLKWKYTMVDNKGVHAYLTGGMVGNEMVLKQTSYSLNSKGQKYYFKLVYRNINASSFDMEMYYSPNNKKFSSFWIIKSVKK